MPFSFHTALSGLKASTAALGVTGNNIANANTTAFKSSSITFEDIFTNSLGSRLNGSGGSMQIGSGVATAAIPTDFSQGNIADSGSPNSAAIQGNGFFVIKNPAGAQVYTRAGDFSINKDGYLVTPNGSEVQGYAANGAVIPAGIPLSSIRIPIGEITDPVATSNVTFKMNLNSTDQTGALFHAQAQIFDSKGVARTLDVTLTKLANGNYGITSSVDGVAATVATNPAVAELAFDVNGDLQSPNTLTITADQTQLGGAALPTFNVNLFETNPDGTQGRPNITNYSAPSAVAAINQTGFAAGALTGISVSPDHDGIVFGVFSNGKVRPIAQLAVAKFNSQDGLSHLGGNMYSETPASGQPSIGAPGTGGRGEVVGAVLEQSNVDIASEFTDLIVAQRSFQANSRVITTISQTLADLIQNVN